MADNQTSYPYLIPLIWQGDGPNPSPNYSSRRQAYSVPGLPTARWNGVESVVGGGSGVLNNYTAQYNNFVNVSSPLEIYLNFEIEGNQLHVAALVYNFDAITTPSNRILFILTNNFTGVQNPDYVHSVVRYHEQTFDIREAGDIQTYFQTIELNNAWSLENLRIVTIVQALGINPIKTIYNASMELLTTVTPPISVLGSPQNLEGIYHDQSEETDHFVELSWDVPVHDNAFLSGYRVFRNNEILANTQNSVLTYIDRNIELDTTYSYHIVAYYDVGFSRPSNEYVVTTGIVTEVDTTIIPLETKLGMNFPNPFNPTTTIYFDLHKPSSVLLDVFNIRGQMIKTLVDTNLQIGRHTIQWDGHDEAGVSVSSGVYFYRLQTEEFVDIKRMVLMK
ncbi:MAG: T9SS type A sorting domain-containing protein [Candidatus Cloacimonetes bacterium]|nr:T9SS type A sorting domain-containing protein [Candidatus Cloacimonadota bacterium]